MCLEDLLSGCIVIMLVVEGMRGTVWDCSLAIGAWLKGGEMEGEGDGGRG